MAAEKIKIIIVDDQQTVRKGLKMRLALEEDLEIVGEAKDGQAALQLAQALKPDIVVMDIEMPKMDGLTATKILLGQAPGVLVIVLSMHDNPILRAQAREAGAIAYVEKHGGAVGLIREIRQAFKNR